MTYPIFDSVPWWAVAAPFGMLALVVVAFLVARSAASLSAAGICNDMGARRLGSLEAPTWIEAARHLADRAEAPATSLWVVPGAQVNLFAMADGPDTMRVAVTSGAIEGLSVDEAEAALGMVFARAQRPDFHYSTIAAGVGLAASTLAGFGFIRPEEAEDHPLTWPLGVPLVVAGASLARLVGGRSPGPLTELEGAAISGRARETARLLEQMEFTAQHAPLSMSAALSRLALVDPRGEAERPSLRRLFPSPPSSAQRAALLRSVGPTPDRPERARAA
jgi:hypothetical protein